MSDPVAANPFDRQWEDTGRDVLNAVERVGRSGWYILGSEVQAFEAALGEVVGASHVIGCASGLDALEIGLRSLGIQPGDRVLTTPLTAFATALSIVRAGGVPVFVDVDQQGLLDLDAAAERLAAGDVRYMVPVHLFGAAVSLEGLAELRDRFELRIVEDAAQAVAATRDGHRVGSAGQATALSFYPTKNLGALGDGGALTTDDEGVEGLARSLRDYGQSKKYVHDHLGLNSRLDEVHAAVLRDAFLPRLGGWHERRAAHAKRYVEGIDNAEVCVISESFPAGSVWHLFPVCVRPEHREAFLGMLRDGGVQAGIHYPVLAPEQAALESSPGGFEVVGDLANAKAMKASEVSLPINPYLRDDEIDRVIARINRWRP